MKSAVSDDPLGLLSFWSLYDSGRWEPDTRKTIQRFCGPGALFVDVGAWIGPTARWALETGATVVAIEPDLVAWLELQRQVGGRVESHHCAVGRAAGQAWLGRNPKDGGMFGDSMSRMVAAGESPAEMRCLVEVRTLPAIVGDRRPALVKVDIEGGEIDLLPAIVPWLVEVGSALQVSFHGQFVDRSMFDGWAEVSWPTDTWGDLVAVP